MNIMRNAEGYYDVTAGIAIARTAKQEEQIERDAQKAAIAIRMVAEHYGFELPAPIELTHKKTGVIHRA